MVTFWPPLDANKHWNGLVRDFYAKRVGCYISQAAIDIPLTPPTPSACKFGQLVPCVPYLLFGCFPISRALSVSFGPKTDA